MWCTSRYNTRVIPFCVSFDSGISLYEQVVYAAKKAVVSGQMSAGDPFPCVRELSKTLKINPNTAHKVVTHLVAEGILEVRYGIGTAVPTGGLTDVFGHDSRKLSQEDFTQIGYVSENEQMPDCMTVEYFMNYLRPFYPGWGAARAENLLRQFELPPDRKIRNLSHGMRMKAALASSLAYRPRLIVLDEPFTGLDARVRDDWIEGVWGCADGSTFLIACKDFSEFER